MANAQTKSATRSERLSVFELYTHYFAVDIVQIREVISLPVYTPLPNSNSTYLGVFNLRGEIFPLVDISTILGFPSKEIYPDDMVVLLEHNKMVLGVVVDKIYGMITISPNEVKLPKGLVSHSLENFVSGVVNHTQGQIFILDIHSLFKSPEIIAYV